MLRWLFIDMNSYFASVEQQDRPELRGRPVAVVPMLADTTCCIAASYEAKAFGVKTGTLVGEARRKCPGLVFVEGRHRRYVEVHHQILKAVESCLHVDRVMSIDEMACRLMAGERAAEAATTLARRVKAALRAQVGTELRCSIGVGPNVTLAKVAADMQKPDGLTLLPSEELPRRLWELELQDLPGIGPRMFKRLRRSGLTSVRQLTSLNQSELAALWGSKVHGERWHALLRGEDLVEPQSERKSLGHSHVLPPKLRTESGAVAVLQRMLHKAAWRMRSYGLAARALTVHVRMLGGPQWRSAARTEPLADTPNLLHILLELWRKRPAGKPLKVGVVFGELIELAKLPPQLYGRDRRLLALSQAMDRLNEKFGVQAAYFGGIHGVLDRAPTRIAFNRIPELEPTAIE